MEALLALARRRQVELDLEDARRIVASMLSLPPHPEVPGAMKRLADANFRMVTLTNSTTEAVTSQMRNAGLAGFFERLISVDEVRLFKPAPEVYRMAAERLDIDIDQGLLIAAHDWDIAGARMAGMPGAFVARPGAVWGLPDPEPDLVAPDLVALAELLIA